MSNELLKRWACQKMIEASQSNIWDGHWACAVLALIHLLEEKLVPCELENLIRQNLDKIVEDHPNEGMYRNDEAHDDYRSGLIQLLIQNGSTSNALGHDVIYGYYILDLLTRSDVPATAELYHAMMRLLEGFATSGPGYVTVNGENMVIDSNNIATTARRFQLTSPSLLDLFHNFSRPQHMELGDMQLGHLLTHGHAIVEIKRAYRGHDLRILDEALFTRVDILNYANTLEASAASETHGLVNSEVIRSPLEPSYWELALSDSRHGHYYKYAYSYLKLNRMDERHSIDFRSFSRIL